MPFRSTFGRAALLAVIACASSLADPGTRPTTPPGPQRLAEHVFRQTRQYLQDFRHPQTGVLYGARLVTKNAWTSPADIRAGKPKPWGYGSRIADTVLHCGHLLVALLDAHDARPDPFLEQNIRRTFAALRYIGSLPHTHPKPGLPDLEGLVPRGPHPDDPTAYYDDSSMDQHTTFIIALALYARSPLARADEQSWIRKTLQQVGRRLEKNGWSIKRGDGTTQAHVGFAWTGFNSDHASILLPAVLALYHGTGDPHWKQLYERFLSEKNGVRWQRLHPGPHVRINGHPIYANQNAFRIHAMYVMETDPGRKAVLRKLLRQIATMQIERDFPGPFYRRFHSEREWDQLQQQAGWKDRELHGALEAWDMFRPEMQDWGALPVLAHVRFPLGGFHMVLLSEDHQLIHSYLPQIWQMLTTVDMDKIGAGETNYLMTVVGLHAYAWCFRHPELWKPTRRDEQSSGRSPSLKQLALLKTLDLGPTIDVAVDGNRAFAIGRGQLFCLDMSAPNHPRLVGKLRGLGNVRQILVDGSVAYITSREDGLFIVRISDPDKPEVLCHYDTIEFATGVAKSGDVLLVACRHYGVEKIDVSDPGRPVHLGTVRTGEAQSVAARGRWAYVGVWATAEVVVVDLTKPVRQAVRARVPLDGYGDGVDVRGDYLFAATGHHSRSQPHSTPDDPGFGRGHGLEIFDIRDPAHPRFVSRVKFPPLYNLRHDMWGVTVAGDYAFVADTHNGVFVVDVRDVHQPRIVAHYRLPTVGRTDLPDFVGGLALAENVVLAAGGSTGLHVLAAPDWANQPKRKVTDVPRSLIRPGRATPLRMSAEPAIRTLEVDGKRVLQMEPGGQVHALEVIGDLVILGCGSEGVQVFRWKTSIERTGALATSGFATDVAVAGNRVFVAAGEEGLLACRLSQDGKLTRLGQYRVPGHAVRQVEIVSPDRYALIQVGANRIELIDIGDVANMKPALSDSRLGLLYGDQLMRGVVENRYACAFWHVSGLHFYDLSSQPAPRFSGDTIPIRIGASNGLVSLSDRLLVTRRGGYSVITRGERRPLHEIPLYRVGKANESLGKPVVVGRRLYTANRATGRVCVIDIEDIERPQLIDSLDTDGHPGRVSVSGNRIWIPAGRKGVQIHSVPTE